MKFSEEKAKKLKRITGIFIPVMVLVITGALVGTSFAWFSDKADAKISSLKLTTAPVFTLTFNVASQEVDLYNGQTAFDRDGHLVTEKWATDTTFGKGLSAGSTQYETYIGNKAYARKSVIKLDTEGKKVDLDFDFDKLGIYDREYNEATPPELIKETLKYAIPYVSEDGSIERYYGDIAYGFTWYIKKEGGGEVFTPYGIMTAAQFESGDNTVWSALPARSGVKGFVADNSNYELCVIFAPEKLFWMQYSSSDWTKTVDEVYFQAERDKIYDPANYNTNRSQPFYSTNIYVGVEFDLSARIKVDNIREATQP